MCDSPTAASRRIVLLIGPPGSGKTTVAPFLQKVFGIRNITIKELVDAEIQRATDAGKYLALCREQGRTPNDMTLVDLLRQELKTERCQHGMLLSDFPETLSQGQAMDRILMKTGDREKFRILNLQASDEVCKERLAHRWVHVASGRVYNAKTMAPKSLPENVEPTSANMLDDESGGQLVRLAKDGELQTPKGLFCYHLATEPILEHFGRASYSQVNAETNLQNLITGCVRALAFTSFKRELTFLERNESANAPLPEVTNAIEAEVRVYNLGDRLERRAPVLEAIDRHRQQFMKTRFAS